MTDPVKSESIVSSADVARTLGVDRKRSLASRLRPYLFWVGGALLVALVLLLIVSRRSSGKQPNYQTAEITRAGLTVVVSATGTLQPTNQVEVGSEISGTLRSVDVDYNDRVKKGQVLASIDTARQEALVRQTVASLEGAKARVLQARATVTEAKAKLARLLQVQEASGGKVPSRTELDTAKAVLERADADVANSRASVSQAEASLEGQRIDLTKSVIRSPINGIVLKRTAEPGQTVAASLQTPVLFTLAEDLTQMELQVDVDEADVGKVQQAQSASFTVAAYPDRIFPARVSQVRFGSKTVAGVVTYTAVLKVDNAELLLRPGMTGTANVTVQKVDNALLVPNMALRFAPPVAPVKKAASGGSLLSKMMPRPPSSAPRAQQAGLDKQPHVWIQTNGVLEKIPLAIGMTNGVMTEVKGERLKPGMLVVTDVMEAGK